MRKLVELIWDLLVFLYEMMVWGAHVLWSSRLLSALVVIVVAAVMFSLKSSLVLMLLVPPLALLVLGWACMMLVAVAMARAERKYGE